MVSSKAKTVNEYLLELPKEKREVIEKARQVILDNLPKGYEETMQYGMIGYGVPLKLYSQGYLGDKKTPLPYAALAAQKNYFAIYLMSIYGDKKTEEWFKEEWKKTGKKLDMGKSCIRFKKLEDLPLELIGNIVSKISVKEFIERYETLRQKR